MNKKLGYHRDSTCRRSDRTAFSNSAV